MTLRATPAAQAHDPRPGDHRPAAPLHRPGPLRLARRGARVRRRAAAGRAHRDDLGGIIPYFCDRPCLDLQADRRASPASRSTPRAADAWGTVLAGGPRRHPRARRRRDLEWADPNTYPRAVATAPKDGGELVSVALADGRYVDFTLLDPALRARLTDPRLVFYDPKRIADHRLLRAQGRRYDGWRLVDRLDWGDGWSEDAHHFVELEPADAPYAQSWHTSCCAIRRRSIACPCRTTASASTARRPGRSPGSPPTPTWCSSPAPTTPAAAATTSRSTASACPNRWSPLAAERVVERGHPGRAARVLVAGRNRFRLVRRTDDPRDAELYHVVPATGALSEGLGPAAGGARDTSAGPALIGSARAARRGRGVGRHPRLQRGAEHPGLCWSCCPRSTGSIDAPR
ncbi:MAG: hypothetical protein U0802_12705 [Candidatus Binatia bacterium]